VVEAELQKATEILLPFSRRNTVFFLDPPQPAMETVFIDSGKHDMFWTLSIVPSLGKWTGRWAPLDWRRCGQPTLSRCTPFVRKQLPLLSSPTCAKWSRLWNACAFTIQYSKYLRDSWILRRTLWKHTWRKAPLVTQIEDGPSNIVIRQDS
jgi:hypothetical protein